MKEYKISEVAKITNLAVDTIRYYVKEGIITPKKRGKYHYYDSWDINFLMEYKRYKSHEFSAPQIRTIMFDDDLDTFIERHRQQQGHFEEQAEYYVALADKNRKLLALLEKAKEDLTQCRIIEEPELKTILHRIMDDYQIDSKAQDQALLEKWTGAGYAFSQAYIAFRLDNVLSDKPKDDYYWYLGMETPYFELLGLKDSPKVSTRPSHRAIYTVGIVSGEKGDYVQLVKPIKAFAKKNQLTLCGDVSGHLLARLYEDNQFNRYFAVSAPIEEE